MKQNRKDCAVLFEEGEYEQAVLEAYWRSRSKVKMPNNRYPFLCIHCKASHKDKNTVSYHRMFNLCKVYKGDKPLKMYPTWEPSEHGEKARIATKFGKVSSPPHSSVASHKELPPPLDLDVQPFRKRTLLVKYAEHEPPLKKRSQKIKDTTRHLVVLRPPSKTKDPLARALAKVDVPKFSMSPPPSRRKMKATRPPQPQPVSSEEHVDPFSSHSEARSGIKERNSNSPTVTPSIEEVEFRVASHIYVLQLLSSTLSREEIEEQAWSNATQRFDQVRDIEVPPPQVDINGLYIIIIETSDKWVLKELVDDLDACMQYYCSRYSRNGL